MPDLEMQRAVAALAPKHVSREDRSFLLDLIERLREEQMRVNAELTAVLAKLAQQGRRSRSNSRKRRKRRKRKLRSRHG